MAIRFTNSRNFSTVIVGAKRTPVGTFMGGLSAFSAPQLGATAARGAIEQSGIEAKDIDEVLYGAVLQAGMGQAPCRQVALGAGCSQSVPTTTINKVCASGMKSVMMASQAIELGQRKIMLAGGMEAMSKCPHYAYLRMPTAFGPGKLLDSIQADGLMDVYNNILMGSCVEKLTTEMNITREAQDAYAIASYEKMRACQENGTLDWEIVEMVQQTKKGEVIINQDEEPQKFMPQKFAGLKPAFAKNGTITAANSSKLNDGACAFVLMSEEEAKSRGLTPLAKILGYDDAAVAPIDFGIAPSKAVPLALKRAGLDLKDVEYHEVNEAFSAVALANMQALDMDPTRVNVHGGAVAIGHPLGMSGARIILSLINVLRNKDATIGMASICNGGGGASAIVIERMN